MTLGILDGKYSLPPNSTAGYNESEESNLNSLGEWQESQATSLAPGEPSL